MTDRLALHLLSRNQLSHRCGCCLWCNSVLEVFLDNRGISVWFVPVRIIHQVQVNLFTVPSETGVWHDVTIGLTVALFETLFNMVNMLTKRTPCSFIGANVHQKLPSFSWPTLSTQRHTTDHKYGTVCIAYVAQKLMPLFYSLPVPRVGVRLKMKQNWRVQNVCTEL